MLNEDFYKMVTDITPLYKDLSTVVHEYYTATIGCSVCMGRWALKQRKNLTQMDYVNAVHTGVVSEITDDVIARNKEQYKIYTMTDKTERANFIGCYERFIYTRCYDCAENKLFEKNIQYESDDEVNDDVVFFSDSDEE